MSTSGEVDRGPQAVIGKAEDAEVRWLQGPGYLSCLSTASLARVQGPKRFVRGYAEDAVRLVSNMTFAL